MKKYIILFLFFIPGLIFSFSPDNNYKPVITIPDISGKDTIKDIEKELLPSVYYIKSGKSFTILQEYESDYLVNVRVFGNGFSESRDTILFDEIEHVDTIIVADINNDGFEELYIFTRGFFPGAYDHVFGVTSDEDKSYKEINFRYVEPSDVSKGGFLEGHQGQDVYTLENNSIKRVFPVYNAGDFYNNPSGGYRTLYYTIEKSDSGYYFKLKN